MEWFEKEYKKRFEEESSMEGVQADPLWEQISEAIPQQRKIDAYLHWKWLILGVLLIGASTIWMMTTTNSNNSDDTVHLQSQKLQSEITSNKNFTNKNTDTALNTFENTENVESSLEVNLAKEDSEISTPIDQNITGSNALSAISKSLTERIDVEKIENKSSSNLISTSSFTREKYGLESGKATIKNDIPAAINDESKTKEVVAQNEVHVNLVESTESQLPESIESDISSSANTTGTLAEDQMQTLASIFDTKEIAKNDLEGRSTIEISKLDFITTLVEKEQKSISIPEVFNPIIQVDRPNPWSIHIQSAATFFDLRYQDQGDSELFAAQANDSLRALQVGNSFGVGLSYELNSNWQISGGIEINRYENRLRAVLSSDTTAFDSMQVLRKAKRIRTVNHHNKLSTLTIPIDISYNHRLSGSWSLGASFGVSYSLIQLQRGKALGRNNTVVEYSDTSNRQFENFFSLRFNPYLQYQLSEKLAINLNAGVSFQNHGNAAAQDLGQHSLIYRLGMGLSYKL